MRVTPPPRGLLRRAALAVAALLVPAAAVLVAVPAGASAPADPPGWTSVFRDDFNGPAGSGINGADWQYTTGTSYPGGPAGFGTGEIETMTADPSNVSLDGAGNLRITPLRDGGGNWTSGRVETRRSDFQPPAGGRLRVEARIQMPNVTGAAAKGYWPAFWMLGAPYRGNWWNWPGIGEIDIMENVQGINNEWATMHCGTSPGGPCNETTGIGGQRVCSPATCQGGFHTYAAEWDRGTSPEQVRFSLDGVNFHTVRADQMDAATWNAATGHGFFLILNVAMGGAFPGAFGGGPDAGTQPGHPMTVDYVAVWQSGGGTTTPPTPTPTPTPTPPAGGRDAYAAIQAESYDGQAGLTTETTTDTGGGRNVGSAAHGDWARYQAVDFGTRAATQFRARVASGAAGGVSGLVEVRLDSRTNPRSAASPSPTPVAGRAGGPSRRTSRASPASTTSI